MFQQKEFSEGVEELRGRLRDFLPAGQSETLQLRSELTPSDYSGLPGGASQPLKVAKLLTDFGLTSSNAEAQRKLKEGAVRINGQVWTKAVWPLEQSHFTSAAPGQPRNEVPLRIRLGKKAKLVILS
jgi:tyrosyl-tRNA synthetase